VGLCGCNVNSGPVVASEIGHTASTHPLGPQCFGMCPSLCPLKRCDSKYLQVITILRHACLKHCLAYCTLLMPGKLP